MAAETPDSGWVDLRSDTVTRPSDAMRRAMAAAEVGDDGYGEDPTVRALEEQVAELLGKPAALFVPSGTMSNQIALRILCPPGTSVVVGRRQHVVVYELGAAGSNAGAQFHVVDDEGGVLRAADVRWAVEATAFHWPRPSAVFVENTHMAACGAPWPLDAMQAIAAVGLPVHLDGARLLNACIAEGVPAAAYADPATTVTICLSKGLGAPIGSVFAADTGLIVSAREERKRLGGAMRQAGIVAAAGIAALHHNVDRLADDHRRARRLAEAVCERWPACGLDPRMVRTNVVVFRHPDPDALFAHLRQHGVLAGAIEPGVVRLMTHLDVDDDGVERACRALACAP
ncbi:MAG: beta-eliminating lyase-related protein [Acidimicrobiales bacterium]|nr:beta-eliminating lyase-related protein [Acidimicrobiales bacterium]